MERRSERKIRLELEGNKTLDATVIEYPFREGLELEVEYLGETHRVSDRGLGLHEAKRLLLEILDKKAGSLS